MAAEPVAEDLAIVVTLAGLALLVGVVAALIPAWRAAHVRIVADLPRTPTNKVEKYKLRQQILAELAAAAGDKK